MNSDTSITQFLKITGSKRAHYLINQAVRLLPTDVLPKICRIRFISSFDDAWGYVLTSEDIRSEYLIVLSDDLFEQSRDQIIYTILHEIGHVVLGHKNSFGRRQTKSEIQKQELEADAFAMKYIQHYQKERRWRNERLEQIT
jgi:Zn-dependent protease with chaperone function